METDEEIDKWNNVVMAIYLILSLVTFFLFNCVANKYWR